MESPHRAISPRSPREKLLVSLLDALWKRYRGRVAYARRYEELVERHGATFLNDHVAFRTLAWQRPAAGIFSVSRLFEALGYRQAGCYEFPDKRLSSLHFAHENPDFPKVFISQLKAWELSERSRAAIAKSLRRARALPEPSLLAALAAGSRAALPAALDFFARRPWPAPQRRDVEAVDVESQFGAWVLLNGYDVNHFTASIDRHGPGPLVDIEKTVAALEAEGVPMKKEIEGARGSRLRQSATEAVTLDVEVRDGAKTRRIPWTYAYFELAERPALENPATGKKERFDGFFGAQATNLFELTRTARRGR